MTKTEKRLEKQLITQLTHACEELKSQLPQLKFLSHKASIKKLASTLTVQLFCTHEGLNKEQLKLALHTLNKHLGEINCLIKPNQITLPVD